MRQWTEQPDDKRQTGRTTKMLEAVKAHKARPVVVVAGNQAQAKLMMQQMRNNNVSTDGMKFVAIGSLASALRGVSNGTKIFYDHLAIEIMVRNEIGNILRKAERMMKESGQ